MDVTGTGADVIGIGAHRGEEVEDEEGEGENGGGHREASKGLCPRQSPDEGGVHNWSSQTVDQTVAQTVVAQSAVSKQNPKTALRLGGHARW
eukprot:601867-Pyramimonas_sp.AAC.1